MEQKIENLEEEIRALKADSIVQYDILKVIKEEQEENNRKNRSRYRFMLVEFILMWLFVLISAFEIAKLGG